jgi:hypothetical protein
VALFDVVNFINLIVNRVSLLMSSGDVVSSLIRAKCLPIQLNVTKAFLYFHVIRHSFEFTVTCLFMMLSKGFNFLPVQSNSHCKVFTAMYCF